MQRTNSAKTRFARAASQNSGLPRGRSFQNPRVLTPAQAAQDAYHHRKAAKILAAKKKAVAAKAEWQGADARDVDKKEVEPTDVINITVDAKGVMIDSAKGTAQGMGTRTNSRSRMTRSTSKSRNSFRRVEDKENVTADMSSFKAVEADVEAYFGRKRSVDLSRRKKDNHGEVASSWDGSMPKRQSSRSFMERMTRDNTTSNANVEEAEAEKHPAVPKSEADPNTSDKSQPHRSQKLAALKKAIEQDDLAMEALRERLATANLRNTAQHKYGSQEITTPMTRQAEECAEMRPGKLTPGMQESAHHGHFGLKAKDFGEMDVGSDAVMERLHPQGQVDCVDKHDKKALTSGKWCDDCAGLGLHIAALLSEMDKRRSSSDSSSEGSSSSSSSKKGWKSMMTQSVLGDSKSKSNTEKVRLQQEIDVLKATVEFLYKKVEVMEKSGAVATQDAT